MVIPPRRPLHPQVLSLGKYHIRYSRGSGIAQAIWMVWIGSFDLIILMDANINDQGYCCNRMVYYVVFSKEIMTTDRDAQGGLGMVRFLKNMSRIDLHRFYGRSGSVYFRRYPHS